MSCFILMLLFQPQKYLSLNEGIFSLVPADLIWVADRRAAVTGITNTIIICVLLVLVGDSLTIIQKVLNT